MEQVKGCKHQQIGPAVYRTLMQTRGIGKWVRTNGHTVCVVCQHIMQISFWCGAYQKHQQQKKRNPFLYGRSVFHSAVLRTTLRPSPCKYKDCRCLNHDSGRGKDSGTLVIDQFHCNDFIGLITEPVTSQNPSPSRNHGSDIEEGWSSALLAQFLFG